MRKALVGLLAVLVAGGVLLYLPRDGVSIANAATISVLKGEVDARRSGGEFAPALDGELLQGGDIVRASDTGRAVLTFFDGSTVTVEPGSSVSVTSLDRSGDSLSVVIEQALGRTWASIQRLASGSRFEIRTPTSTAVVRGTTFETVVERRSDGTLVTTLRTGEGEVAVRSTAGGPETTVPAGMQITIPAGAPTPAAPEPRPEAPELRFGAPAEVDLTIVDPRGLTCGSSGEHRQIIGCDTTTGVVVRAPVPGVYRLAVSAERPVGAAAVTLEGRRGGSLDFSVGSQPRDLGAGELVRLTVDVTVAADGTLGSGGFSTPDGARSRCDAEAAGAVFSSGPPRDRESALRAFGRANPGEPATLVFTSAELSEIALATASAARDIPGTLSGIVVTADRAGLHLAADLTAGPITVPLRADIVAGAVGGTLRLRVRSLEAGPIPKALADEIARRIEGGLGEYASAFPLEVERVAFRADCTGVQGQTP